MTHTPTPMDLLEQGLGLLAQWPTNPFLLEGCQRHLNEVAEHLQPDQPLPQLNDESVLVALGRVSIPLMLAWAGKVGERAWEPAVSNPYPLADLFEGPLSELSDTLQITGVSGITQAWAGIKALVEQGMRVAMPLRNPDLLASNDLDEPTRRALHHAQDQIRRTGLRHHNWADAGWVAQQIDLNDGAWVFSRSMSPTQVVNHPTFTPTKQVAYHDPVDSMVKPGRWQDLWEERLERKSEDVLPWLEQHGQDVQQLKRKALLKQIREQALRKGSTLERKWTETLGRLDRFPDIAGQHCRLTGLPFGLRALRMNGALLTTALKNPPPCGLDAKGPGGHTIWDAVLFPEYPQDSGQVAPLTALKRLLKKVPLAWGNQTGLMWEPYSPGWARSFSQDTLMEHPRLWLGSPEHAEKGAAKILVGLACGDESAKHVLNAAQSAAMLAKLWQHQPDLFTPTLVDLLGAIRKVIATAPSRFGSAAQDVLAITPPQPQHSPWATLVKPNFEQHQGIYSGGQPDLLKSEGVLVAAMLKSDLEAQLPTRPPTPKLRF